MILKREPLSNRVLGGLDSGQLNRVRAYFQRATLMPSERIPRAAQGTEGIWFPEAGFISVLICQASGLETEIAIVGREGAVNVMAPRPDGMSYRFMAQARGVAHFIAAEHVTAVLSLAPHLRDALAAAATGLFDQVAATAHANARGTIVERLARWLLSADDRVDGEALFFTHEMLAAMLAVRRVGVTNALHVLEGRLQIRAVRGHIRILDRAALIGSTNGLYVQEHGPRRDEESSDPACA